MLLSVITGGSTEKNSDCKFYCQLYDMLYDNVSTF